MVLMWCRLTDQKCGRLTGIWVYTFCVQMELTSWISNKICWFKLWCFKCCQHTCFMEYSFDNNQEMWNCLCGYPRNQEKTWSRWPRCCGKCGRPPFPGYYYFKEWSKCIQMIFLQGMATKSRVVFPFSFNMYVCVCSWTAVCTKGIGK